MLQADLMDDLILETANACTPATAQADKVNVISRARELAVAVADGTRA